MIRNLDLTALRSFVAVADEGGVTRAAGFLSLTQSAVSMQIKRLEDMLGADLVSAALRHARDAEWLAHRSPDQAYHLAGYAPECARKATV